MRRSVAVVLVSLCVVLMAAGCSRPDNAGNARLQVQVGSALVSTANIDRVTIRVSGAGISPDLVQVLTRTGNTWTGTVLHIPAGAGRTFTARAFDAGGTLWYEGSAVATVTAGQTIGVVITAVEVSPAPPFTNRPPVIDSVVISALTVETHGSISLTATAHDPDLDPLTYAWASAPASAGSFSAPAALATTWTAGSVAEPVSLSLRVTDSKSATAMVTIAIEVVPPQDGSAEVTVNLVHKPVFEQLWTDPSRVNVGESFTLHLAASDIDGYPLAYSVDPTWFSCHATQLSASADGTTATFRVVQVADGPGANPAVCIVEARADNGHGGIGSGTVVVNIGPYAPTEVVGPVFDGASQSRPTAYRGEQVDFYLAYHSPQGLPLSYYSQVGNGSLSALQFFGDHASGTLVPGPCAAPASVTLQVCNSSGPLLACSNHTFLVDTCAPASCQVIRDGDLDRQLQSGLYLIDPDQAGPGAPVQTYCALNDYDTSWMLTTDSCGGFRQSGFNSHVRFAVSNSTTWDPAKHYGCPAGYYWASTAAAASLLRSSRGAGTNFVYSGKCGWSGTNWAGQDRYKFRFTDSLDKASYEHSEEDEGDALILNSTDTDYFAGIVCIENSYVP